MLLITEGYISQVKPFSVLNGFSFTIEPTSPYLFDDKINGNKREILLRDGITAKIVSVTCEFSFQNPPPNNLFDVNSILIMKANRIKVKLEVDEKTLTASTAKVVSITVL